MRAAFLDLFVVLEEVFLKLHKVDIARSGNKNKRERKAIDFSLSLHSTHHY